MRSDIDVFGVKLAQLVDGAEQAVDACALEWGQHLEGECRAGSIGDGVDDAHLSEELKVKSFELLNLDFVVAILPCPVSLRP